MEDDVSLISFSGLFFHITKSSF